MKSNSSKRFAGREPGGLDPVLPAVAVAGGHLGAEQRFDELLIAPGLLSGPVGQRRERSGGRGCFQRPEQVGELCLARSCDQRVIDRQRPLLDIDLVALAAALALDLEAVLVRGVDDRLIPGEDPTVAGGELTGVQTRSP